LLNSTRAMRDPVLARALAKASAALRRRAAFVEVIDPDSCSTRIRSMPQEAARSGLAVEGGLLAGIGSCAKTLLAVMSRASSRRKSVKLLRYRLTILYSQLKSSILYKKAAKDKTAHRRGSLPGSHAC